MEQLPQYKTKECRYGNTCHRLSKGTCTFAHSTEELRKYFNPWINAQYGVCIVQGHAVIEFKSFNQKWSAIQFFKERVQSDDVNTVVAVTCKDSCLFIQFPTHAVMLIGLPVQDNTAVHTALVESATVLPGKDVVLVAD